MTEREEMKVLEALWGGEERDLVEEGVSKCVVMLVYEDVVMMK